MSATATFTTEINLTPERLNLHLYAGDGATVRLKFAQQGAPLDMSNGEIKAQIRAKRLDPAPAATWAVNSDDAANGLIILSLTGDETGELMEYYNAQTYRFGFKGSWDVQWHPTGLDPVTLFQGDLYCNADVTR